MNDITLEQARTAVEAAVAKARDPGLKMNIAVVDAGANLKAFARMEGAWLGSIDIAIRKARPFPRGLVSPRCLLACCPVAYAPPCSRSQ